MSTRPEIKLAEEHIRMKEIRGDTEHHFDQLIMLVGSIDSELDLAQGEIDDKDEVIEELEEQVEYLEEENHDLKDEIKHLEKQIEELEEKLNVQP